MKYPVTKFLKSLYFSLLLLASLGIAFYKADFSIFGLTGFFVAISLFFFWFAVIGKAIQSLIAMFFTLITLQLTNQAKIYYFKSRLFFTDFIIAADGNNFDTLNQYSEMYVVIAALFIIIALSIYCFRKGVRYGWKLRIPALILFFGISFGVYQITLLKDNILEWQSKLPNGKGVIVNVLMTLKGMNYQPPFFDGTDELFLERANKIQLGQSDQVKPDIVIFLQESTNDSDYFTLGDTNLPKISMFDPKADFISAYGPLRVQTTGGGTWLSEFSFATGLDTNDFADRKHSVFYTVAPHIKTSFYKELKNNGYYTVLLTPMTKDNYNTRNAYENFGIDLVLQPQDLGYDAPINNNLWKITSHEMLEHVYQILEKYSDKPVAVFMLSMNEHGPYNENAEDKLGISPYFEDEKVARRLNDYLERQEDLNKATDYFANKVLTRDRPTLFLYFGDHQPNLFGKAVKEHLFKKPLYVTQFVMKDNFTGNNIPIQGQLTDINFLGGVILERIHAAVTPYYNANIKMRHLCDGKLEDCEDQELVNSYKYYIYNVLKVAGSNTD